MPPRKSDSSRKSDVTTARLVPASEEPEDLPAGSSTPGQTPSKKGQPGASESKDTVSIDDLNLPKSIITRLAKGVLPEHTQIQSNAILALRQGATVFINYLAAQANEHTQAANKKTIMPADVFKALDDIEFGFLRPTLEAEFTKYAQIQSFKRTSYRQKVAAAKRAATDGGTADAAGEAHAYDTEPDETGSKPKKARVSGGAPDEEEVDDAETEPEDEQDEEEEDDDAADEDEEEEEEEEEDDDGANEDDEIEDAMEDQEDQIDDEDADDSD